MNLRDYQEIFLARADAAWQRHRCLLGVSPTGTGKTVMFSEAIRRHRGPSCIIAHRIEIIEQNSLALARAGIKHRVVAPEEAVRAIRRAHLNALRKSWVDQRAPAGVASVQTLTSKSSLRNSETRRWVDSVSLSVLDEGHHYVRTGKWGAVLDLLSKAKILGMTACAERADGLGLGAHADGYAEALIEAPGTQQQIDNGYLSPFQYKAPETDINFDGVNVGTLGDLSTRMMKQRIEGSSLVGNAEDHYLQFAAGKKAILFANDIETAGRHSDAFRARGVNAQVVTGADLAGARRDARKQFEHGDLSVLISVDLLDEGLDIPGVECVIMARRTLSLNKFLQMCGRALRPVYAPGHPRASPEDRRAAIAAGPKPCAILIDMVRNWEVHRLPNQPRVWSLDSKDKCPSSSQPGEIPLSPCLKCTTPFRRSSRECPDCGEERPPPGGRSSPEKVDGRLVDLDVEAWERLYREMYRAQQSDEEYMQEQISRRVPSTYRYANLKKHRHRRERVQVLNELINWWIRAQNTADLGEAQSIFYYRFGVDMATAMSLNTKSTDALILKIQNGFEYA